MILLSTTVLLYNQTRINYEILRTGAILFFKPFFYNCEENLPFIVLIRLRDGWKFQEEIDNELQEQVMDDINSLRIN